jgi:hypothetical protein
MNKIKHLTIWLFVLVSLFITFQAVSSVGVVPAFPISDIPHNQTYPGLASNPSADQFLVVWEDFRGLTGFGSEVYGQLVNGDGTMAGANFPITVENDWQRGPRAVYNPTTDQYLVIWEDQTDDLDDIEGQLVKADGTLQGSKLVISAAKNDQSNPEIAYNSAANEYLVVFDDDRLVEYDQDIYGVLVNANGTASGEDFPIATHAESQLLPVVAYNSRDNQYLVVWWDKRSGVNAEVYARVVNTDGSMDGSDFLVASPSADWVTPDVAYDRFKNQYLVVWEEGTRIYGRLIKADKTFVGPEFRIDSSTRSVSDPAVAYDSSSKQFLVVWSDGYGWDDIRARLVGSDGSMLEDAFDMASGMGDYFYPDVAFDEVANQFLTVWRNETCYQTFDNCEDNDIDIYGALYRAKVHIGLYLPIVIGDYEPLPPPPATTPAPTATTTPTVTTTPKPTNTATPTPTATATPNEWSTILSEDFEGDFPGSWAVFDDQPLNEAYYWGKRNCEPNNGSNSGWAVGAGGTSLSCGSVYPNHVDAWMIYGPFDLSDATEAEMHLSIWVNTTPAPSELYDYVCWMASTNGTDFAGDCAWGESAVWSDQILDFSSVPGYVGAMIGQSQVWVGLYFHSDSSGVLATGAYVDDILVRKCVGGGCPVSASGISVPEGSGLYTFTATKSLDQP